MRRFQEIDWTHEDTDRVVGFTLYDSITEKTIHAFVVSVHTGLVWNVNHGGKQWTLYTPSEELSAWLNEHAPNAHTWRESRTPILGIDVLFEDEALATEFRMRFG